MSMQSTTKRPDDVMRAFSLASCSARRNRWDSGSDMEGLQLYIIMEEFGERIAFPSAILEGYEHGRSIREGDTPLQYAAVIVGVALGVLAV